MKKKLMIIGVARSGKDTVTELLRDDYGYSYVTSSMFCAELFIFDKLKSLYGYSTIEECFEDRVNHRPEWFQMIADFNKDNPTRLTKAILSKYDIYTGCRNRVELIPAKEQGLVDHIIWVDASLRVPNEPASSMNLTIDLADYVLDNNKGLSALNYNIKKMVDNLNL